MKNKIKRYITLLAMLLTTSINAQTPLGSEFTYQGELNFSGSPATGEFDFNFKLFEASTSGGQIGSDVLVEDVTVSNGLFTTTIDFGTNAFIGDKVWMEINVRVGASTGSFTQLSPLQQITSTPYAIHAQFVGANAVTGTEILNNSITSADIGSNAVGSSEIITTQVQRRIASGCAANEFIRSVNEDGSVVCDADSGGLNSITSADIVDGTIIRDDVDSSQIQTRVDSSCDEGYYLSGINQDGTVICNRLATGLNIELEIVGFNPYNSITIGSDDLPIISYYDDSTLVNDLKVVKCHNSTCSNNSIYTLDSIGDVGQYNSIAIGPDNLPMISYYDVTNADLKFYKCNNNDCSSGTASTLQSSGFVGQYTSIILGGDDLPLISYYDSFYENLKVFHCDNAQCSSGTSQLLDEIGSVGKYSSITRTIYAAGQYYIYISYYDDTNDDLKLYKCTVDDCSSGSASTIDSAGIVGQYTSIASSRFSQTFISYYDSTNKDLKLYKCSNADCTTNEVLTLDSIGDIGQYTSIAIGNDDLPIISYYENSGQNLKVFKCDTSCSLGVASRTAGFGQIGEFSSITVGADGFPLISYYRSTRRLKLFSCGDEACRK